MQRPGGHLNEKTMGHPKKLNTPVKIKEKMICIMYSYKEKDKDAIGTYITTKISKTTQ